ncbi:RNA-binding protein [Methylobacterium fujisawaense]|uniref:hypothetical protein n=2 Tax=Bacteria TaxID=2 RepID=UPI0036FC72CF
MSDGIPFGAGPASPLDGLSPELIARLLQSQQPQQASPVDSLLFDRAGMGAPGNGFSGRSGTIVEPQQAQSRPEPPVTGALPQPAPASAAPAGAAPVAPAARPAPAPAPAAAPGSGDGMQPVNSFDPLSGQPVSGSPKPIAPAQGAKPEGGFDLGSALSRMSQSGLSDQLIAIGAGILSGRNFGEGLGQGLSNAQKTATAAAANQLQQLKLQREQAALTGNAQILKRAYPNLSDSELAAMATNSGTVTTALQILRDPTHGMPKTPEQMQAEARAQAAGTMEGGAKPLDRIQAEAQAQSAGAMSGNVKPLDRIEAEARAQSAGAAAGKPDETYTPLSEADRVARGLPAGAYQVDSKNKVSPINPTGTTINMGAEKAQDATVGKAYGDYQVELATKGRNAANTLNSLALMEQAMKTPGFYSGVGGEGVKRANQFLAALGVKDPRAASATEVFDALSNKVVLDGLGGSLGPGISNTDRDYIARTAPTLAQSQQGNSDLIGIARNLAQRQQAVSKLAREYAASNGGRLDSGFDAKLEEYAGQNPLFPQAAAGASASPPREAPQGAPAGARQAPDGQWYVSDPNRPGKYLKVQ